jgi:hypothetical protein
LRAYTLNVCPLLPCPGSTQWHILSAGRPDVPQLDNARTVPRVGSTSARTDLELKALPRRHQTRARVQTVARRKVRLAGLHATKGQEKGNVEALASPGEVTAG